MSQPAEMLNETVLTLTLLRMSVGLTQAELAGRLGLSRATIIRWEAGTTRPAAHHVAALARHLGVPVLLVLTALHGVGA